MNYLTIEEQARYTSLSRNLRPLFQETLNNLRKKIKPVLDGINERVGSTPGKPLQGPNQYSQALRTPLLTSMAFFIYQKVSQTEPNDSGHPGNNLDWVDYSKLSERQRILAFPFVEGLYAASAISWGRAMANLLAGEYLKEQGTWAISAGTEAQANQIRGYNRSSRYPLENEIVIATVINSMLLAVGQAFRRGDYDTIDTALAAFWEATSSVPRPDLSNIRYRNVKNHVHHSLCRFLVYLSVQTGDSNIHSRYIDFLNKFHSSASGQSRSVNSILFFNTSGEWTEDQQELADFREDSNPSEDTLFSLETIYPTNFLNFYNHETILVRVDSASWSTTELGKMPKYTLPIDSSSDNFFYLFLHNVKLGGEPLDHDNMIGLSWMQEALENTPTNFIPSLESIHRPITLPDSTHWSD
ncbi:hypothetical protein H4R33_006316 [Dimargaris cristalligena]|uniref:Uncharacterized protein n=1 Tax=Dimargaris cristalligena TaxID=215637 RepID=A0A4P9ZRA0_9FUNG|nr:hypothetical protein H4R33_006316 [Dimargaris cristalligena]RKP34960.1 hypothetical protein BJ085DRAFT_29822 [Dimargaris cristalligena]|eukprot:RKP34960.1 hypothetical protein BJ085DRAFT_29822 [Dimargaris cristalligena]